RATRGPAGARWARSFRTATSRRTGGEGVEQLRQLEAHPRGEREGRGLDGPGERGGIGPGCRRDLEGLGLESAVVVEPRDEHGADLVLDHAAVVRRAVEEVREH